MLDLHPYRRKIAKFSCKFPSVWTENSVHMRINVRPYGRPIANSWCQQIEVTAAYVHLMHQYTQFICDTMPDGQPM